MSRHETNVRWPICGFCDTVAAYEAETHMGPVARLCPFCLPVYGRKINCIVPGVPFLMLCTCGRQWEFDLAGLAHFLDTDQPAVQCCGPNSSLIPEEAVDYVRSNFMIT